MNKYFLEMSKLFIKSVLFIDKTTLCQKTWRQPPFETRHRGSLQLHFQLICQTLLIIIAAFFEIFREKLFCGNCSFFFRYLDPVFFFDIWIQVFFYIWIQVFFWYFDPGFSLYLDPGFFYIWIQVFFWIQNVGSTPNQCLPMPTDTDVICERPLMDYKAEDRNTPKHTLNVMTQLPKKKKHSNNVIFSQLLHM